MDETFELRGITFVWDSEKARRNVAKHRISLSEAAEVFFDPFFKLVDASPDEEVRDAVIGMDSRTRLLFVVHLLIEDDCVRLISARRAEPSERQIYED